MPRPEPSHRAPRVRRRVRLGAAVAAVATTLVVGAASIVPQLPGDAPAEAGTGPALSSSPATSLPAPGTLDVEPVITAVQEAATAEVLPAASGQGRRIVFSQSRQRVWLVGKDDEVARTYLVSGSIHDNLQPGTYAVTSRLRQATAFDYSGTMEYFVEFTRGRTAPIGFHTVPRDNAGELEQTRAQLGTPLSAGCVRQWRDDAVALWEFAPVGTTVVVTA